MAETKTTKPRASKPKVTNEAEVANNAEVLSEQPNTAPVADAENAAEEEVNTAPVADAENVAEKVDETAPETVDGQPEVEEDQNPKEETITPENVAEKIAEEVSSINSATEKELNDFYNHLDDAVKEAQNAEPGEVAEVASKKLNELAEIEKQLEKEVEVEAKLLSDTQKKAVGNLFGRGFGDFWNGVSSGWEN